MGGRRHLIANLTLQKIKDSIKIIFRFSSQEIGIAEIEDTLKKFQERQL